MAMMGVLTLQAQKLGFPILGGELSNSAATSVADIDEVMPRMRALGLNTVLIPAYWEFVEPVEGQFDFTLIDRTIDVTRQEQLHVVFLWFGAWKNSMSCYAPGWFKQDTKRFPRAMTAEGKQMEIASCFSDNVLQADLNAFSALMQHIKERDPQREVVIMMQIENEIGMLESARDHSPLRPGDQVRPLPRRTRHEDRFPRDLPRQRPHRHGRLHPGVQRDRLRGPRTRGPRADDGGRAHRHARLRPARAPLRRSTVRR